MMLWIFIVAGLGFATAQPKSGGSYFISFSRDLHRGMPFNVSVDILNTTFPVHVKAELQRVFYNLTKYSKIPVASAEGDFFKGKTGNLQLMTPSQLQTGRYVLHVRGTNGLQFEREMDVSFTYKTISIMIQTDKAMYKPGQTVQYRVFGIYPNLQVYTGMFRVTITDPNNNKIKISTKLQHPTGVVTGEFKLADRTVFGDWKISAQPDEQIETEVKTFTVAEYKLPRFEVTVELPPFAVVSDEALTGTVKAKYTFGKTVKGMVELKAMIDTSNNICAPPPKYVQQAFPIDGEAKFSLPMGDLKRLRFSLLKQTITIIAIVKEELTGVRLNGSNTVEFFEHPYKIEILSSSPSTFSPKLPYSAILKVSQPDGRPLTGITSPVSVYTCVKYREIKVDQSMYGCHEFTGSKGLPAQNHSLTASGILPVHMRIPENTYQLEIKAHYREATDTYTVNKKNSLSDNYMQIRLENTNMKAGQMASFVLEYTEPVTSFTYQVLARGTVLLTGDIEPVNGQNPFKFQVPVSYDMAPVAYIVVYYVRTSGEVVADSISFTVDDVFDNQVSVAFSRNESEPHQNISVLVSADPLSSVNVLAVDQSVLLLKSGNDITTEQVLDELKTYGSGRSSGDFTPEVYAIASSASRAPDIFSNAGLNVITDARYYNHFFQNHRLRNQNFQSFGGAMMNDGMVAEARAAPQSAMAFSAKGPSPPPPPGGLKKVERVRSVFPEAWLWLSQTVGPDGKASISTTVPDTITSWIASAFAVNPTTGLGVAPTTTKLRVFQSFFVSLSMPTSVLRNETVVIQASVFNYLSSDVDVTVQLPISPDYVSIVVDVLGKTTEESKVQNRYIRVKSKQPQTVYFPIKPINTGSIDIEISARSQIAADAVKRQLVVHYEGIKKEYSTPLFVGLARGSNNFQYTMPLTLPAETTRGSEKARVKVTGNLIGSSLDNLENLLSMPMGCGEQNMMNFAPSMYIANYLTGTRQMTPALWSKIIENIEMGLQRQLTYQRSDGSFSAFGNRDEAGSMWLTAFVTRAFHQARPYILVDNSTLTRALNWMTQRQNKDGSFNEPGLVIDKKVQRSRSALTAMVLLSLMENRDMLEKPGPVNAYEKTTGAAVQYLESMVASMNDTFTLAVVSLALYKAGSTQADIPYNKLNGYAKMQGSLKYWTESGTSSTPAPNTYYKIWSPPHVPVQPLDIQITSYALMSYTARGDLRGGFPITMWLTTQRNPHGGFSSTQDTMVALQALTEFSQRIHMSGFQVNLDIKGANDFIQVSVTDSNALVLQSRELSSFPNEVTVTASGVGVAYIEVDVFFNVNDEIGNPSFDVNAVLLDDTTDKFRLMVCSKWLKKDSSGMAVMEISIPSGFEPDMTSVGNVAGIKRVERRGRNVVVYFDQISTTSICFDILATRTDMVSDNKPSYITVKDYYQPENQASIFYQPRSLKTATICDVCTKCCT